MEKKSLPELFLDRKPVSKTAQNILKKRYFSAGETKWEDVVNRVIEYVLPNATEEQKETTRNMMLGTYFVPNSPCLVNSGKPYAGLSACVPGYVRIPTDKGLVKISDVVDSMVGEYVYNGEQATKILARRNNGVKDVVRISTERGHLLYLTEDHRVRVYDKKKRGKWRWEYVKNTSLGDILEFSDKEIAFPKNEFDPELSTLLGYLYSDGCFTTDQNGNRVVEFIVNSEEEEELIKKINKKYTGEDNLTVRNKISYVRLRGYGNDRYKFLERFSPFYGDVCRVPEEIFLSNKPAISRFVSSLFSADGTISYTKGKKFKYANVSLSMANESFIRDVGGLLEYFGIRYSVSTYTDKRKEYNRRPLWKIIITDKHSLCIFSKEIGFLNPTKNEKLIEYLKEHPLLETQLHKKNLKLAITKKEEIGKEIVYDIQTESESFLSNNFVVHNCFVVDFPDDTVGIYKTKLDFALIARKGGGCGTSLHQIRPEGSPVAGSTHGYAGGGVKFADTISHDMDAMTQSGLI